MTGGQENEMSVSLLDGDATLLECGQLPLDGQHPLLAVAVLEAAAIVPVIDPGPVAAFEVRPAKSPFRLYPEWAQRGPFW